MAEPGMMTCAWNFHFSNSILANAGMQTATVGSGVARNTAPGPSAEGHEPGYQRLVPNGQQGWNPAAEVGVGALN